MRQRIAQRFNDFQEAGHATGRLLLTYAPTLEALQRDIYAAFFSQATGVWLRLQTGPNLLRESGTVRPSASSLEN